MVGLRIVGAAGLAWLSAAGWGCAGGAGAGGRTGAAREEAGAPTPNASLDALAGEEGEGGLTRRLEEDAAEASRLLAERGAVSAAGEPGSGGVLASPRPRPAERGASLPTAADAEASAGPTWEPALTAAAPASPEEESRREGEPMATPEERIERLAVELGERLRDRAAGEGSPMRTLAAVAALELAWPGAGEERGSGAEGRLSTGEADALRVWRELVSTVSTALGDGAGSFDLVGAMVEAGERASRLEQFGIARAALCSRVEGYGRYTELFVHGGAGSMETGSVLAGRAQRAIVYVEPVNFGHRDGSGPDGEAGYTVEMTQELSLFSADGLLAWRRPEETITDFSRNRRRDFFVVQMIELPATLSVGTYSLKVRMRDVQSGAEAEVNVPVSVVADAGLVNTR